MADAGIPLASPGENSRRVSAAGGGSFARMKGETLAAITGSSAAGRKFRLACVKLQSKFVCKIYRASRINRAAAPSSSSSHRIPPLFGSSVFRRLFFVLFEISFRAERVVAPPPRMKARRES